MKKFEVRLTSDSQFSHGIVFAGSLVATISMSEPIEPTSLLSMIQFSQASIVAVEQEELEPELEPESESSANEDQSEEDLGENEVVEDPKVVSDLADFLDESLIESLAANKITTKDGLFGFISSGKNLVDLEKIGPTRAKRILAAIVAMQETQN
jgi:hypothetical protein